MRGKTLFGLTMAIALLASLLAIGPIVAAQPLPRMYLTPSTVVADQGSTFTLEVWVENVVNLYAWEFKVGLDIYVLTLLSPPLEGPFLKSGGFPTFFAWHYNPQAGELLVGCTLLGVVPPVSGTGKIAEIRFIADEPGQTTHVDLFDTKLYDHYLNLMPQDVPGDATVTVQWPPALWETELWLSAAKGGKMWTEYQTSYMMWDPMYGVVMHWEDNIVHCRIRNTGTAGVYVRVWMAFTDETGYTEDWDPYENIPLTTEGVIIAPGGSVITSSNVGNVDPLWIVTKPPFMVFQSGTFTLTGQIQVSFDGLRWYNWGDFDPALPGDGFSRATPGGDTGKFKVHP